MGIPLLRPVLFACPVVLCVLGLCISGQPVLAGGVAQAGAGTAAGAPVEAGDLQISGGWVRAMLPGQKTGAGYFSVSNKGTVADRLLSVSSGRAPRVEIHSMRMDGDVMTMRPVEGGIEIPAGGTVALAPGGFHLMLLDVPSPLQPGETVEMDLRFERAGTVRLTLPVQKTGG